MEEAFKKIKCLLIGSVLFFVIFGILPATAQAATLYFSPSSGTHAIGATFAVNVYVSSADQAMNAASGVISFPSDKLEVTSLSKTGSIFTLWVQEPSFSNSAGTVNFEGIVLNPGFTGSSGKAITITFRTKAAGNAPLTFSSGSALANDGKGTNILTGLGNASFSLGNVPPPKVSDTAALAAGAGVPAAPVISSQTHPDPDKWYTSHDAVFFWKLPAGVSAVRTFVSKTPQAIPAVTYAPAISSKQVTDLADGIWYFHVRLQNAAGWGAVSHFRFQVDTTPPEQFAIYFNDGKETDNPRPTVTVDYRDAVSGNAGHSEVKIDNGEWFDSNYETHEEKPDQAYIFRLPLQQPGRHTIAVKALDKAGNSTVALDEFVIVPIEAPIITDYPKELQSGEVFALKGTTRFPNARITIWLQHEKNNAVSYTAKSGYDGKFIFIAEDRLLNGVYTAWADVTDARGAKSNPSEKITVFVEQPSFLRIGSRAIGFLAVVIPLVILIFALLFVIWHGWHKFGSFRIRLRRIRKDVREAESALHKAFDLLKEDMRDQIKMLEKTSTKRQLTEEEEKIVKQLRRDLDSVEKFVKKRIEAIEKET